MLHLDAEDVTSALDYGQAVEVLRETLREGFDPSGDPPRSHAELSQGEFLFMPAEVGAHVGAKILTVTPGNAEAGLPRIQGTFLLLNAWTHQPLATMDGAALTSVRTPAVSIAGIADVLARRFDRPLRVVVFGSGVQAGLHVHALRAVARIAEVTVVVRKVGHGLSTVRSVAAASVPVTEAVVGTSEAAEAVRRSDVVFTTTSASEPLFAATDVPDSCVLVAMGSHSPEARETPGELYARASVIVESRHSARAECGDLVLAAAEGHLDWNTVVTFAEVVRSQAADIDASRPVVFKTSGMSWEDVAIGARIYDAATADPARWE